MVIEAELEVGDEGKVDGQWFPILVIVWIIEAEQAFQEIKRRLTTALVLVLPGFMSPYELHCDALKLGIGDHLSQNGRPVAYFNETLLGAKLRYNTYDVEFYVVMQAKSKGNINLSSFYKTGSCSKVRNFVYPSVAFEPRLFKSCILKDMWGKTELFN
ncbi:hypothetical protein LWI29_029166 [Acer saccharum]|uniref:Reverse transcriptase/retrotransposon-derived protein RNase H-like domain-containing protein n=1 Tax=Acer saccharum TaxID=4024 RepID=A0AA39S9X7_ACESA|nr:hypothetical protein LWI29_029166 [Acer saccharum]